MMKVANADEFFVDDEPLESIESALSAGRPVVTGRPEQAPGGTHKVGAKFVVVKTKTGQFRFDLQAANGATIATSENYDTQEAALEGIASVRNSAGNAAIEFATA